MNRKENKTSSLLLFVLGLFCLLLWSTASVRADGKEFVIPGTVYTSRLPDGAKLIMRGDASIIVNENKTIASIEGRDESELHITRDINGGGVLTILQTDTQPAIYAGAVSIDAPVAITAPLSLGIQAKTRSIDLGKNADVKIVALGGMKAAKTVDLEGKLYVLSEALDAVEAGERILVQGGSVDVSAKTGLFAGLHAAGNVELLQGKVKSFGYYGIYSDKGNIIIQNTADCTGEHTGVFANGGNLTVSGSLTCKGEENGAKSWKTLEVTSQGSVTASGVQTGLEGYKELILAGTVIAKASTGFALESDYKISVKGGTVEAESPNQAVAGPMEIAPSLMILSPAGAVVEDRTVITLEGEKAKYVKIGVGQMISGQLTIPDNGEILTEDKLTANLTGAPEGQVHYQWQRRSDMSYLSKWTNIKGATSDTYTGNPREDSYYARCLVTIDGYAGALVSNEVRVHECFPQVSIQPKDVEALVGQSFTVTLDAWNVESYKWQLYKAVTTAEGNISYEWVNSSMNKDTEYAKIEGQGTGSITITPKNVFMNGLFLSCDMKSPQGKWASTRMIALKVAIPPAEKKGTTFTVDGVEYKVMNEKPLRVRYLKNNNTKFANVVIPGTVSYNSHTYRISSIGSKAFMDNTKLKDVKIGPYVTTIKEKAFYGCTKLKSVLIGKSVETIEAYAFKNCKALASLTLPEKVKNIKKQAFYGCSGLKNLSITTTKLTSGSVKSKAFSKTPKDIHVFAPKSKLGYYVKILRNKGISKKAVFTVPKG